eukprot:CAMPEP_0197859636 /NCGR_PEP_ID=MMETSP1438-20131217/34369_1 /TAXON_ID=1461541 /ORGANISM="Pterosperma sp., Strain CCMP1384" /LENGTH=40 /DNA_ID= /DNA_START= /DNA_END= /DNA_ORIENTATION=
MDSDSDQGDAVKMLLQFWSWEYSHVCASPHRVDGWMDGWM